jgi:hypothetical protein
MPHQPSPKVIEWLDAAAEATRRLYERESDPDARLTYLQIEQCWRRLADRYAFMEQLEAFTKSPPQDVRASPRRQPNK